MTEPAPRKRHALKNACVMTWKIAAVYAPTPAARNMNPSCDTVEYARTFLMSFWAMPIDAAKIAVTAPTMATTSDASSDMRNSTFDRTTMYTPAVTIVAAWMSAETGVGPAIASGSQTYRGTCADLPHAPTNSSRQIAVAIQPYCASLPCAASANTRS